MFTRLIYLISFVLALSLVGNVQAQTATWTDAAPGDHLWSRSMEPLSNSMLIDQTCSFPSRRNIS